MKKLQGIFGGLAAIVDKMKNISNKAFFHIFGCIKIVHVERLYAGDLNTPIVCNSLDVNCCSLSKR